MILCEIHTETHFDSDIFHHYILLKTEICTHILPKLHSTKFLENLSQFPICYIHTTGWTSKHGTGNMTTFLRFFLNMPK